MSDPAVFQARQLPQARLVSIGNFQSSFQQSETMKLVRALPMEEIERLG
jgi:hypothetical protein